MMKNMRNLSFSVFGPIVTMIFLELNLPGQELRTPLAKEPLQINPQSRQRLIVKFLDEIKARATQAGGIESTSNPPMDLTNVLIVAGNHSVTFFPALDIPEDRLDDLRSRAAENTGAAQADLAGILIADLPEETSDTLQAAGEEFLGLNEVEFAYLESLDVSPPDHAPCAGTMDYRSSQSYRGPSPGMNMELAWTLGHSRGQGIRFSDCEYSWDLDHDDLHAIPIPIMIESTFTPSDFIDIYKYHGTAVLGMICSKENLVPIGSLGLVPDAKVCVYLQQVKGSTLPRTQTCITNSLIDSCAGDIVLLEIQTKSGSCMDCVPAEFEVGIWLEVQIGTNKGVIVVAAAGNGNQDLDSLFYKPYMDRDMGKGSGAIIVGAGTASTSHDKLPNSTFGSRVNVQGWGQNVFTLGEGKMSSTTLPSPPPTCSLDQLYRSDFSGTSSASAMVAAACVSLQSFAEFKLCRRLTPSEMLQIFLDSVLVDPSIQQGSGGHIGPFINMQAAQQRLMLLPNHCTQFRRGDANNDGVIDISDPIFILSYKFLGGMTPSCLDAADVDDNEVIDLTDAICLLHWLFLGKTPPPPPFPACGTDPIPCRLNKLGCASFNCP